MAGDDILVSTVAERATAKDFSVYPDC